MTFTNKKRKNSSTEEKVTNCSGKCAVAGPLLLVALLYFRNESVEGVFIERPKDATVIVNHSTFFNCSISSNKSTEPIWYHHPLVGTRQFVNYDNRIRDKYKDRFSIDKDITSGRFNLLVQRPEPTDAGRYECVEDVEEDKGPSAELTVLDSNLVCKSNKNLNEIVGPTECTNPIAPDQLQLLCSVTYSGNFPPQLEWRKVGSELESNETKCGVSGNRVMCNTTLEAKFNMDGFVYICQVRTAEQCNCSLKVNKTRYTFSDPSVRTISTTEEAICSANTSKDLPCSYKWYKDNKTEHIKSGQTLKPSNPGLYRCEAECKIRNEICAFTAMVINASEPETGNRKLLGLLVLLIIPLAVLAYYVWRKRNRRNKSARESAEMQPALQNSHDQQLAKEEKTTPLKSPVRRMADGELHEGGQLHEEGVKHTVETTELAGSEASAAVQETKIYCKEDPVLVNTIKTKAAAEFDKRISGLAIADNELFITTFSINFIEVYDLKSFIFSRSWILDPLQNPLDLAYCSGNICLYVMDAGILDDQKNIIKVDRNGELIRPMMWTTGMGYGCISVTYDCNILMVDCEGNKITEYTSDGENVREINLSINRGFLHPQHAIKLTDSRYLISHGEWRDPLHRVCAVDTSGEIQMSFGGEGGSTSDHLFFPIYLTMDSAGSIFVVDRDNNRVLLLSSGLKLTRKIISRKKEGIHLPERLAFDQANGRLLVAHTDERWSESRVFIFKIL